MNIIFIGVFSTVLLLRFYWFHISHAVNILFADQWPLYNNFTYNPTVFDLFFYQYGPHRQGIGYIFTWIIALLSNWNIYSEVAFSIFIQILTFLSIIILKYRIFRKFHWTDILIPISVFSLKYFESFVVIPNVSHAILPVFLITLLANLLLLTSSYKYLLIALIGVLTLYTGFGIVSAPLIMLILIASFYSKTSDKNSNYKKIALIFMALGSLSFFIGYKYNTSAGCTVNPLVDYPNYPSFLGSMIVNYVAIFNEFPKWVNFIGLGYFLLLLSLLCKQTMFLFQRNNQNKHVYAVNFLFIGTSVLFLLATTIGRTCIGLPASQVSRYLLYQLPALISIYFILLRSEYNKAIKFVLFGTLLFITTDFISMKNISYVSNGYYNRKKEWIECYLQIESVYVCDAKGEFTILVDDTAEHILQYTKEHNLMFYRK